LNVSRNHNYCYYSRFCHDLATLVRTVCLCTGWVLQAAPFTVRSIPDFRNTNGMEEKRVAWLFWHPDFRVGAARTDTWHCLFPRDWKWRRHILCIQRTLYRALFWRINRYISTYTYYMLLESQGWSKSTSKNVAKHM
jgi:hypothetical protein